jgi:mannose-6-phosphate isomerase-like protein (cupin superfamily)
MKRIDELPSILEGAVKLAADDLGVETFGLQVIDLPPGFADYPEHDHAEDRQEEVYVVIAGSARFEIGGDAADVEAGTIVRVDAETKRKLVPGPHGARVLAIGCSPGGTYERPAGFRR